MDLRVCLPSTELFAWGRYGGIGAATREIGAELAKRGVKVTVILPRGEGQSREETLDGMRVISHRLDEYPFTGGLYKEVCADVYHSQEPNLGTLLAYCSAPGAVHVATVQNPRTRQDWRLVEPYYPLRRRIYNTLLWEKMRRTVQSLDGVYVQAWSLAEKTRRIYDLACSPGFLPNPVEIPCAPHKSAEPTILFLGRFDSEKAPERFFRLAGENPGTRFIAAGRSHDPRLDESLRRRYGALRNLELPGLVTGAEKRRLLDEAWILVNTSVSEGLPVSFLEAAAHGCAILSPHDPDGFASRYGCRYRGDPGIGLGWLLEEDRWKNLGEAGRSYVAEVHEKGKVIDRHIEIYKHLAG